MAELDAILPAGGRLSGHFESVVGVPCKPLIKFDGTTILYRTIHALRASGCVRRIVLVGTREVLEHRDARLADLRIPEKETGPQNIMAGLSALCESADAPERVLLCTTDLPFLTPDGIRAFVERCENADFYAGLITREEWDDAYPMCDATFVKLLDGKYTLGCLYNVRTIALKRALNHVEKVFAQRKSKLGMAKLLGVKFVWKYLTQALTVPDVVNRVQEVLGSTIVPLREVPPELAYDVDALEDYHYALQNYRSCLAGKWMPPADQ